MNILTVAKLYIIIITLLTFTCFGVDKYKARNHKWRIKEATLIGMCVLGGSLGGLAGMYIFHHKTKKPLFFISVPLILIIQIAAVLFFVSKGQL